jgi:hypothetical protein
VESIDVELGGTVIRWAVIEGEPNRAGGNGLVADCPGGRCAPMIDECTGGYSTFACAFSGPGSCKTTADCSNDTPPFGPGDRYCHLGSCTDLIQGTDCN